MFSKNAEYWQPVLTALKKELQNDPYVNQEAMTRKLLYAYFQSGAEDVMQKAPTPPPQGAQPAQGGPQGGNPLANAVMNKQLSTAAAGAVQ